MISRGWCLASAAAALALVSGAVPSPAAFKTSWSVEFNQANANFGSNAINVGDVNGDGYPDILVSAPFASVTKANEGQVLVFYGGAAGPDTAVGWSAASGQAGSLFGWSIAALGDVNVDGYDDIAVGAPLYDHSLTDEGGDNEMLEIDEGCDDDERHKHPIGKRERPGKGAPDGEEQKRGDQLDSEITKPDRRAAMEQWATP